MDRCWRRKRQRQVASKARLRKSSNSGSRYEIKECRKAELATTDGTGTCPSSFSDVPNSSNAR